MFFYRRTETNAKQAVRFNSRQTICLEQFLLRLFYSFPLYIFYTFLHILSHFSVRHIVIVSYLFQHNYANLENLENLYSLENDLGEVETSLPLSASFYFTVDF